MKASESDTAEWLTDLRQAKGLSPEEVPHAMRRAKIDLREIPSSRTVRRAEETGRMPHVRYAFGLAKFYEVEVGQLWPANRNGRVAA